jgi:micrococcal nuclease
VGDRRAFPGRALVAGALLAACAAAAEPPAGLPHSRVVAVGDGDTITVQLGERRERVRLIGVDAPELHESPKLDRDAKRSRRSRRDIQADGARARAFTADRLLGGTVSLERDVEPRDRFGRLLAYVWLDDGTLFNVELVRAGWARTLTVPPNVRHVDALLEAQRAARAARRGFWGDRHAPRRPAASSRRSASPTAAAAASTARNGSASAFAAAGPRCSRRVRRVSMNAL